MLRFRLNAMSMPREFTVDEANALLPVLEPLMGRLLEKRAKSVSLSKELPDIINDMRNDVGGPVASEMARDFVIIEQLIDEIQSHGCVVKNVSAGLLDFLSERDERLVYLCWRYGEPKVTFYHELHTGFSGRRRI